MFRGLSGREILARNPDNGAGNGIGETPDPAAGGNGDGGTPPQAPTFETYYAGLDDAHKALVDGHVTGLKTALQSERTERGNLARQIGDLKSKAEKGSDLEKQLGEVSSKLESAERRATFAEEAIKPEVGCVNVKAAYALALADNLFNSRGQPDWNGLKAAAPELFRRPGAGSADGGAGNGTAPKLDMNAIIRRAAGRG